MKGNPIPDLRDAIHKLLCVDFGQLELDVRNEDRDWDGPGPVVDVTKLYLEEICISPKLRNSIKLVL